LQALRLEPLNVDDTVDNSAFQAEVGGTFAAIAPALEGALRHAESSGELLLVEMADLGRRQFIRVGALILPRGHDVFSAIRRAALSAAE
jgi:hypothetical protein